MHWALQRQAFCQPGHSSNAYSKHLARVQSLFCPPGQPRDPESMYHMTPRMGHRPDCDAMGVSQVPEQHEPFRRSTSLTYVPLTHLPESPVLCQTPVHQQRQLSGSFSGETLRCWHDFGRIVITVVVLQI